MVLKRLVATLLSAAFHPLLLPSYLFYLVCYQLPGVVHYPLPAARGQLMALVVLFTFVLPAVGTALLLWTGAVQGNLELRERQQRPLPLLLAVLCFGGAALYLYCIPQAFDALLRHMMIGMTLAVLLTLLISLRWKISAHGVGVGGATGLLALLYIGGSATLWWLLGSVALALAVVCARLILHAHTPAQAWVGLGLGLILVLGFGLGLTLK